jgi:ribosome-associated translation inhibitor RaiA
MLQRLASEEELEKVRALSERIKKFERTINKLQERKKDEQCRPSSTPTDFLDDLT